MALERTVKARLETEAAGEKNAFREAAEAVEELADRARDAERPLESLGESAGELSEKTEKAGEGLGHMAEDLAAAKAQVDAFVERSKRGGEGIEEFATRARFQLDRLREQAEALRRSGQGLTDEHARELAELERAYAEAVAAAGKYKRAQADATRDVAEAGRAAGEARGSFGSLADILGELSNPLARLTARWGAYAAAAAAGYQAGTQIRDLVAGLDRQLNTQLLPTFDNWIQRTLRLEKVMATFFLPAKDVNADAQEMANILNILTSKGIQPVSGGLEALRAQLRQVAEAEGEVARETAALGAATEEWAQGLGLSRQQLDETAAQLASFVAHFQAQNAELDQARFGEALKPQLQALLDGYKSLGREAPPEIQRLAEAFRVVDSATEAVLQKQQGLIQQYVDQLREAMGALPADARENAAALLEAFRSVDLGQLQFLPPEKKEEFKRQFEEMVQAVRAAGGAITPEMVAIGAQVGLLLTEMAPLSPEAERVAESFRAAGQALRESATGAQEVGSALPGEELAQAAQGAREVEEAAGSAAGGLEKLGESSAASGEAVAGQGEAAKKAAEGTGAAAAEADRLAQAQDAGAKKAEELAGNLAKVDEIAGRVESAGAKIVAALRELEQIDVSPAVGQLDGLLSKLAAIEKQAGQTGAALAEALSAEGG